MTKRNLSRKSVIYRWGNDSLDVMTDEQTDQFDFVKYLVVDKWHDKKIHKEYIVMTVDKYPKIVIKKQMSKYDDNIVVWWIIKWTSQTFESENDQ